MKMTKYQKALIYIRKAELQYGSISKTPENDPNLIKARKLLAVNRDNVKVFEPDDLDFEIKRKLEYGYPAHVIYEMLHVGQPAVQRVREFYGLKYKPIFKYKLTKDGQPDFYTTYAKGMCRAAGIDNGHTARQIFKLMSQRGYEVSKISFYWGDLPDDCTYAIRNSIVYVKHGIDSWLSEAWNRKDNETKIIIDTPIYDELAKYCKKTNEPISMVASKAIKKYINME